jgi:ABC-type glutathione transport system ATPase component
MIDVPPVVTNETPALAVAGVSKTFVRRSGLFARPAYTHALRDVSFTLERGQILGVVGESGSGKTTLGRVVVGLETPDRGEVRFFDRVLVGGTPRRIVPAAERGIGMIFQDPYSSLNPRMSVHDIVGEGLQIAGKLSRREMNAAVGEALTLVGLRPEDSQRYPHQFSGGQRQRIGIARAIALKPKVLIADEAVSSLDVSVQMQVLNLLLDIRDTLQLSLVFITHNIGVVEYLCDQVIVMSRGEVVERGDTSKVITSPEHAYTRRLIEAVPRI